MPSDDKSGSDKSFAGGDGGIGGDFTSVTTYTSWFDRIKNALLGIVFGLVLIVVAIWLLVWNEGRAVQTARSLAEGASAIQAVNADRIDPAMEGRLVYTTGSLTVPGTLRDADFGVAAQGAVRLIRTVEMYQWREESRSDTRSRVGGGQETVTTYSYTRGWSETANDSTRFREPSGHQNPAMRYASRSQTAPEATLGAFQLTGALLSGLNDTQPLAADAAIAAPTPAAQSAPSADPKDGGSPAPSNGNVQVVDGRVYIGANPQAPQIGDMRISFAVVRASTVSVVARQVGTGFGPYQTHAGDRIQMISAGTIPAETMFRSAEEGNALLTWILRAVGIVAMLIGWALILNPLAVIGDVIPILGEIVRAGTLLLSVAITSIIAPVTIAIAWFWYRPVVAAIVLAIGGALTYGSAHLARSRWRRAQSAAPQAR